MPIYWKIRVDYTKKVITSKHDKHVYQGGTTSNKTQITVLLAVSATAHYVKPLVVYPGVQPRRELRDDFHNRFPEGLFGNSPSGWMDTELFHSWLENGFNESIVERCVKKPVLLLIDGAKCHISIQAGEFCKENNIILYTLYPNATHLIQPLDLVLMNIVKTNYQSEVRHWLKENPGALYDKYVFIQVFKEVWQKSAKVEYAIKGFEESGIYPINPDAIKKGKLAPTEVYKRPEPLPEIANESLVNEEADPEVPNEDAAPRPSTSTGSVTPVINIPKPGNMIITVGKRKFECVPIEGESDGAEKSKKQKLDEIFQIPWAEQKAKTGPAHMQGLPKLPCCISDECYIKMLKDKEDKKKEEEEKRKKEHEEKAEKAYRERTKSSIERSKAGPTEGATSEETTQEV